MPKRPGALFGVLLVAGAGAATAQSGASPCTPKTAVDVVTHHNNNSRTGANLLETCLTPSNVNANSFGRLFSLTVTGQIYAQPLIVSKLEIQGKIRNVVYVATMENHVYAFDADGEEALPLWDRFLGAPLTVDRVPKDIGAVLGQYNIEPVVGITSTPVIDRDNNTIFVVAKIADPSKGCTRQVATGLCPVVYRIFALDLVKGDTMAAQTIQLPTPEIEEMPCALDPRKTTPMDAARIHLQRPALLLSKGRIYVGFGSHQDAPCPMYHGMLIAFDAHPLQQRPVQFNSTFTEPGKNGIGKGGIWQAGNGPAADDEGNVYLMTGNGEFDPGKQFGGNLVKLDSDLKPLAYFAPANVNRLNDPYWDIDLGSSGPVLLPDTDQAVGGGKEGRLYLVQRSDPGGWQKHGWPHDHTGPPVQFFWAAHRWSLGLYSWIPFAMATGFHHIHGSPVFWGEAGSPGKLEEGTLYIWPERDHVKAFAYKSGKFATKAIATGQKAGEGMPGGFLSISANHMQDGILWAALPLHDDAWIRIVRGSLRAFKATPDGSTLT
jgi:outer membrane protein assembly factor BamB